MWLRVLFNVEHTYLDTPNILPLMALIKKTDLDFFKSDPKLPHSFDMTKFTHKKIGPFFEGPINVIISMFCIHDISTFYF